MPTMPARGSKSCQPEPEELKLQQLLQTKTERRWKECVCGACSVARRTGVVARLLQHLGDGHVRRKQRRVCAVVAADRRVAQVLARHQHGARGSTHLIMMIDRSGTVSNQRRVLIGKRGGGRTWPL
eukprot:COSAG06_NODE_29128_length_562_cov_0.844492_2_plen_126_part_00